MKTYTYTYTLNSLTFFDSESPFWWITAISCGVDDSDEKLLIFLVDSTLDTVVAC